MDLIEDFQAYWEGKLAALGLRDQALEAHWSPYFQRGFDGCFVPLYTFDEKCYKSEDAIEIVGIWMKLSQSPNAPPDRILNDDHYSPRYYVLPGTKAAIAQAEGLCFIVANAFEVLRYRAMGIDNVICWVPPENRVPHDLINALELLGVQQVFCIVKTHENANELVQQLLAKLTDSGIQGIIFGFLGTR